MKVNYREGMFLGKEEMERRALVEGSLTDSYAQMITTTSGWGKTGLLDCNKMGVDCSTGENPYVYLHTSKQSEFQANLGRAVIGVDKNGNKIGLPCEVNGWSHAFNEVSINLEGLISGETYLIALKAATTHYENALISVSSTGVGSFPVNGAKVINMFRQGTTGRHSKIKLENGTILTVTSVDTVNNTVQFEGTSFTAVTGSKFMFVQTLSPFVTDNPEPLYTYPSAEAVVLSVPPSDGLAFVIGEMNYYDETDQDFNLNDSNYAPYTWLDTVRDNQIKTSHIQNYAVTSAKIQNQAVTSAKIANGAVTAAEIANGAVIRSKIAAGAFGYRKLLDDPGHQGDILQVEPGSIITDYYNEENPYNGRFIEAYDIEGITMGETYMMPAKVIMGPNHYQGVPTRELRSYFQNRGTTEYGADFLLDVDMEGIVPDSEHLCVFDFYWQGANRVFVQFKYVNLNW